MEKAPYSFEETSDAEISKAYEIIDDLHQKIVNKDEEAKEYNNMEGLFELEKTNYKHLKECWVELSNLKIM